ncbi:MAG: SoxR reducing system RseC family protein [Lachnospirales bacterium]
MAEIAKVVEVNGSKVVGILTRTSACAGCHACEMGDNPTEMKITAINECDAKIGDNIYVEISTQIMMKATIIMYVVPLCTMFLGFLLGNLYSEMAGFLIGLIFLFFTYVGIRLFSNKLDEKKYMAVATKIVE